MHGALLAGWLKCLPSVLQEPLSSFCACSAKPLLLHFFYATSLKSHHIYGPHLSSFLPSQPPISNFTASASSLGGDGLSGCNQNEKCS